MITLKKNKYPLLPQCKFLCDVILDPKLNDYEVTKFLNCHSTTLFVGKPKSGKTSLLYSFFKSKKLLKQCFENIFLFQPRHSRASMKDKLFDQLDDNKKFDELTYENLKYVADTIKDEVEEEPEINNVIIFDDMGAYLRDTHVKKLLKELVMNRRHYHTSIYFLCQTYKSLEPDIRKLFSNIFLFKVYKKEMEDIMNEIIEGHKDNIDEIIKLVFDKPYNYLFINTDTQKLFKNFDEIIFSDDV